MHAHKQAQEPGVIKELEGASRLSPSGPQGLFMKGMEMRVNLSFQLLSARLEWGSLLLMTVDWYRKSLPASITDLWYIKFDMSPAGCTETEDDTHIGFDRRPRLPFLPMTGVPKCSGLVRGSLSSVCKGDKQQQWASVPPSQTINWKQKIYLVYLEEILFMGFHLLQRRDLPNTRHSLHLATLLWYQLMFPGNTSQLKF